MLGVSTVSKMALRKVQRFGAPSQVLLRRLATTIEKRQSPKPISTAKRPGQVFVRAGLPLLLFTIGASLVVASAVEGKQREREVFSGRNISKTERQARMEEEHDEMLRKIQKAVEADFDNTKRIERPEEILARRKRERDERNRWYRRLGRWIRGVDN